MTMNVADKIKELTAAVDRDAAKATYHIDMFRIAAVNGDAAEVERQREFALLAQGQMMDTIYATVTFMRQNGVKIK